MSTFSGDQEKVPRGRVEPLKSTTADGKRYERRPDVESEIGRMLLLAELEWYLASDGLQNETLIYLIRRVYVQPTSMETAGCLIIELNKRMMRLAKRWARGLDPVSTEEILMQVHIEILDLVLAPKPTRQTEFLEVAFAQAVQRRTINAVEKYNSSVLSRCDELYIEDGGDGNALLGLMDERPDPEAIMLKEQDEVQRREWVQKAQNAVEDPRHLEAVILHYCYGWPIESNDPLKPDLAHKFNATPRQIKYWIAKALESMREAIGVEK